jgi:hypothetical protein
LTSDFDGFDTRSEEHSVTHLRGGILAFGFLALGLVANNASAQSIITQWTFDTQGVTGAPPYNNSPTASTGTGTAIVLGMDNNYGTPGQSFASADILADAGSSNPATSNQAWRIRGQGTSQSGPNSANGWSTLAPEYTQGAEFNVSTAGYNKIGISFDWQPTNRGVEDIELQYNLNTANSAGWTNAQLYSNTVSGGVWNNGNTFDLSSIAGAANDAAFGIRIVSAYHPGTSTYYDTTGAVLNNSSGNIRFDNVTISGVGLNAAVPEPASIVLGVVGMAAAAVTARLRRKSS